MALLVATYFYNFVNYVHINRKRRVVVITLDILNFQTVKAKILKMFSLCRKTRDINCVGERTSCTLLQDNVLGVAFRRRQLVDCVGKRINNSSVVPTVGACRNVSTVDNNGNVGTRACLYNHAS